MFSNLSASFETDARNKVQNKSLKKPSPLPET